VIVDLPSTTTAKIGKRLVDLRDSGGAVALGRVLTLVVPTDDEHAEEAIEAANSASREHPCRIIVLARGERRGTSRLDGQIRVGGDAGASEVVVMRSYGPLSDHGDSMVLPLLLPDAPVVTWWPGEAPASVSRDPLGALAQRRITDSAAAPDPVAMLARIGREHAAGDTDFAWSRLTLWRGLLATALDGDPTGIEGATVSGAADSPSSELLAAWLAWALQVDVERVPTARGTGIAGVVLRGGGREVSLTRPSGTVATLVQPDQPDRRLALPRRPVTECLSEELRRLDPDDVFGDVVTAGVPLFERAVAERAGAGARPAAAASA
jgi:glucose-6-phosphate dehydrogenase assembly protein OpcA